ncbi:MAG: nicotinamide-nucleotide amidohydrolase family protein [Actinomycetia bacterium]|nr:nicotinamide-nucleotide amidohydrolase family protein [Actinomycetes bacterium]
MPGTGNGAAGVVAAMRERGLTLAVAESLTGGLVMAALTEVPGASAVLRGGPVVYATDTKTSALGVNAELLAARGPVDPEVAAAMASSVRQLWQADVGLSTTGVAGPDPQAGSPVGEVYVAVAGAEGSAVHRVDLAPAGDRDSIRRETVRLALAAILEHLGLAGEASVGPRGYTGGTPDHGSDVSQNVLGPNRKERR